MTEQRRPSVTEPEPDEPGAYEIDDGEHVWRFSGRTEPETPRDTPHLDRDGDRWREHPSEARFAVTDAGPRSESRSSGGWQGGPSGDDIDRAVAVVESSRLTHVHWAEWRRNGGTGDDMAGDLEHHEEAIRGYDHVLTVLRQARQAMKEAAQ